MIRAACLLLIGAAIASPALADERPNIVNTVTVSSQQECAAACSAAVPSCRSWSYHQPDSRKPVASCRMETPPPPPPWTSTQALSELNVYRAQYGLSPLSLDDKLMAASQAHSDDISQTGAAGHAGSDGKFHDTRLKRAGYAFSITAENVATGQESWEEAFQAWKDSPGHNKNLLMPDVTQLGIALTYEPSTKYLTYWTMVLAAPF
ncbi:MAG: CAP domain-containing protein [Robiginitomaculum sp.]